MTETRELDAELADTYDLPTTPCRVCGEPTRHVDTEIPRECRPGRGEDR